MINNPDSLNSNQLELAIIGKKHNSDDDSAISKLNCHGISMKFSNYHKERQFRDLSIFKSSKFAVLKAAKEYENLVNKKELQEYDHIKKLLSIKKNKEKIKHLRLVTLLANHKALEDRMDQAAIFIQKFIRGFLIRKKYQVELREISMKLLLGKVGILENAVDKCLLYIGNIPNQAAILIQKNVRKIFAMRNFLKIKEDIKINREKLKIQRIIKVQSLVRRFLCKKQLQRIKEENKIREKLEKIRKKLLVLKLKDFWHRKKYVFETIRKKYAAISEESSLVASETVISTIFQKTIDLTKTASRVSSRNQSLIESSKNILLSREQIQISKPPKFPKQLALKYLKPTESFINRTSQDVEETKIIINHKVKTINGQNFQRNTHSRINYISQVQNDINKKKKRATSADYNRNSSILSRIKIASLASMNELTESFREPDRKTALVNPLLKKVENPPSSLPEEIVERLYVYSAPRAQSISFKDALPDVNSLLETYAKNLKIKAQTVDIL